MCTCASVMRTESPPVYHKNESISNHLGKRTKVASLLTKSDEERWWFCYFFLFNPLFAGETWLPRSSPIRTRHPSKTSKGCLILFPRINLTSVVNLLMWAADALPAFMRVRGAVCLNYLVVVSYFWGEANTLATQVSPVLCTFIPALLSLDCWWKTLITNDVKLKRSCRLNLQVWGSCWNHSQRSERLSWSDLKMAASWKRSGGAQGRDVEIWLNSDQVWFLDKVAEPDNTSHQISY